MVTSCVNGWRTSLNVPSMYHVFVLTNSSSWEGIANTRCRRFLTSMSACKNSSGRWFSSKENSKSVGSWGLWCWRSLLAALAMYDGFERAPQGPESSSSKSTYNRHKKKNTILNYEVTCYKIAHFPLQHTSHLQHRQGSLKIIHVHKFIINTFN